MAKKVKSIVITGYGTNCEVEMAHACRLAGSEVVDIVHISEILCGKKRLEDYHFLNLPGGFLDGDYLGSAKVAAIRFLHARIANSDERLIDQLVRFIRDGKLILGVCNGFQLQVKLGLLPALGDQLGIQTATLTFNDSGRFEDRWVYLKVNPDSPCVFTHGLTGLYLPVRHGEGKFLPRDAEVLAEIKAKNLVTLQYSDETFQRPTMVYPANPNGAIEAIAGICDSSGRIFGLMPHPEAYLHRTNHPRWTRENLPEEGSGLAIFRNAISFIRHELL